MKTKDLGQAIEDWKQSLLEEDLAALTIKSYTNSLYQLKSFLESENYFELTKESLNDFKNELLRRRKIGEYKITTVNTKLLGIDRFLVDHKLSELKLKVERVQQKFMLEDRLTLEDLSRLVQRAIEIGDIRDALIMKTLAKTGIRIGELAFFTVENVREALKSLCIPIRNKKKERIILVPLDLSQELLEYASGIGIGSGMIFVNETGTGITDRGHMTERIRKIASECGVNPSHCNSHNFRKLFAVTYLDQTGDLVGLSDILGHSNLATTRIYLHKTIEENNQVVSSLFTNL